MSRMKKGNGLLRFLISAVFFALVLSGCNGTRKYEAVDLSSETAAAESESGSGEEQGTENSDEADLQALGNPAGEMMSADQAAESSQDAESVFESEEMASEMSEEESVAAARESAAEAYTAAANDDAETAPEVPFNGHTVAIDAGHQAKANTSKEPIGPSSSTMKAKMPEGSVGTASGVPEYEVTLAVAKKLETELTNRGYHVVMIRTSNDVNMSSAERSVAAIVDTVCGTTGTKNRGVQETDSSSDINWCEIPVCVLEMGFLSNPDEDTWLQDDGYRGKLASGIAGAVDAYFAEGN